jgi:hypothetical protein
MNMSYIVSASEEVQILELLFLEALANWQCFHPTIFFIENLSQGHQL